jgi:valacyclovir hydrolase
MPKCSLADFAIHFDSLGEGEPLLFLPGALGTGTADFSDQLQWFSQYYLVIAPDPRGYGQSRPPERSYPLDFYQRDAEDMAALMKALGYDRFGVLGWSDGANSGTMMAIGYPELVDRLVVWGGNSFLSSVELHTFQSMRSLSTWSPRAIEPLHAIYGKELQPLWERYITGLEGLYAAGGDLYQADLSKVKCPTLILHGAADPLVPLVHPEKIHRGIVGSEFYNFPEGKHNIHKRYAEEFNRVVLAFLERTKPSTSNLYAKSGHGH